MSPEHWQRIEEIFQTALDLSLSQRAGFVAEKCAGDVALQAEVEKLLSQFEEAGSFIEQPVVSFGRTRVLDAMLPVDVKDPLLGTLLGSYKIEREIGRGGMGAVYEAVRADGEFRRKVAVKIVKRGMDTDYILKRFRTERQILATLEHPYITRLLDGGTTTDGRPYFVMDYIEGLPLYDYCDQRRLSITQRLQLFNKICEAVEYAHQSLVIHRDLKPTNILIARNETPRLLDFGIAKLLDPDLATDGVWSTATGLRLMTLNYASPEQVRGEQITFATDIYSLGVILFEMLTGHRPYRLANRTREELARAICHEPPALPSMSIRNTAALPLAHVDHEALTIRHLAELRDDSPAGLSEKLTGNLDNITLKALQKPPADRYESIVKFREDITRHIAGQTVSAPHYFPPPSEKPVSSAPDTKLIAVLPLKLFNFSASENTDENYLSIGLADAIITRLASLKKFTVRPTSSISRYQMDDTDPLRAGRELGVDFVLEGRLRKFGERFRISLQLLDVRQGTTAWGGQFDERFRDVLELEDAISEQVAQALVAEITGENRVTLGKRGTDNPQAYEAYLKGRFYWNQFTADSLPKAIEWFHKAVALDPNYALAHVGVADFYIWANIYGLIPAAESYLQAETSVKRALEIDDKLGEAWTTFGLVKNNKFDWAEGKRCHERAIELNPNYPNAHEWYSSHLVGSGNFAEGLKEIERAEELDPLSLRTKTLVAFTKYQAHQFQEALAKAEEITDLDPNFPQGHLQRGYVLLEFGRGDEALAEIEKGMTLMPESDLAKYYYCFALAAANRREDAKKVLAEMKSSTAYVKAMFLGFVSVAVGELDEAFVYFNQAADEFDPFLVWLGTDAKHEPIRKDKRYLELLKRTKNPLLRQFEEKFAEVKAQSIAVLPLQFIGEAQTDDAYLSVGLADAMITRLSQVRRIIVRPTNSVLRFTNCEDSFAAGRELGVDFVLSGTIRPAGNRIRVSAQLLEIQTSSVIWSDKLDEKFTNALDLEDLVAARIAKLLIPQLTFEEEQSLAKRGTNSPAAFEAYLRARFHLYQISPAEFAKAKTYFEESIRLDPKYALAYVSLGEYYFALTAFSPVLPRDCYDKIREMAECALRLDDSLGEAYALLGFSCFGDLDFANLEKNWQRSIELNPNYPLVRMWRASLFTFYGETEKAVTEAKRAIALNPPGVFEHSHYAFILYQNHRFDEALAAARKVVAENPNFGVGVGTLGVILAYLGHAQEAVAMVRRAVELSGGNSWMLVNLATIYAKAGETEKAREILRELDEKPFARDVLSWNLALAYLSLGDIERTFAELEKAFAIRSSSLIFINSQPAFDLIRHDGRFVDLIRRIKNPRYSKSA